VTWLQDALGIFVITGMFLAVFVPLACLLGAALDGKLRE